jgi:hypothetical protein
MTVARKAGAVVLGPLVGFATAIKLLESEAVPIGWVWFTAPAIGALATLVLYPHDPKQRDAMYGVTLGVLMFSYVFTPLVAVIWVARYLPD